ncbi:hypothetical protein LSTR_LSTR012811 [Laodelphax striatellus]|uniref:Uncharacterized protein n=1 Tax=Laodelphax striatellus TaxID=195883 RepID=A0A482WRI7_LAOST|nr:hypothetical protein LSTR_LSTR012811 [Laodelphax striatellus]
MIPPVYYSLVTAAVSVNSFKLDPQYRSGEFLTSREHGLDTSNIFHMQQCLQSSGQFNKDLGAMRQHIKDWYMNLAGEHDVDKELCQQVHCAYDLRTFVLIAPLYDRGYELIRIQFCDGRLD